MTAHEILVSKLIIENIARKGLVTLEEAKFYKDFTEKILKSLTESIEEEINAKSQNLNNFNDQVVSGIEENAIISDNPDYSTALSETDIIKNLIKYK